MLAALLLTSRARACWLVATLLGAICAGAIVAGCNYVGAAAYIIEGPPKNPARYTLPSDRKLVVFVDDRRNTAPRRTLRQVIGETAESVIIENTKITADLVLPASSAMRVSTTDRSGAMMSVVDIGRLVGAQVVVYVSLDVFSLTADGASFSPICRARISVIDVDANARLWPPGPPYPLTVNPPTAASGPQGSTERMQAEDALAKTTGVLIGRLFFEHERDALSGRLDD